MQFLYRGASGPKGHLGDVGNPGVAGETGDPGSQGQRGHVGPVGPVGPLGPSGEQGSDGAEGKEGAHGKDGDPGAPGFRGMPGLPGKSGQDGSQGPAGSSGFPGPAGPPGGTLAFKDYAFLVGTGSVGNVALFLLLLLLRRCGLLAVLQLAATRMWDSVLCCFRQRGEAFRGPEHHPLDDDDDELPPAVELPLPPQPSRLRFLFNCCRRTPAPLQPPLPAALGQGDTTAANEMLFSNLQDVYLYHQTAIAARHTARLAELHSEFTQRLFALEHQ